MADNTESGFTAAEEAYFSSGGERELPGLGDDASIGLHTEEGGQQQLEPELNPDVAEQQLEPEKKTGVVPHGALHAEREEHKKTKALLEDLQRNQAVLNDRWNTLLSLQNGGKPEVEAQANIETPPDPTTDFIGYVMWQGEQLKRIETEKAEKQQQTAAESADAEVWNIWDSAVVGPLLSKAGAAIDATLDNTPIGSHAYPGKTWDERYQQAYDDGQGKRDAFANQHSYASTAAVSQKNLSATLFPCLKHAGDCHHSDSDNVKNCVHLHSFQT